MGSSSMIKLLFTLAIVVVTSFLPRNPVAVPIKRSDADTHVYIYNELDLGPTLTVHCWSKDDDLGEQDLPPKFSWDFSFGLDAFGRTRFVCTFEWNVEVHKFPIYVQSRDGYACDICNWTISQAGPCRWKSDSESVCYHWEDGAKHSTEYLPTSP